MRRRALAFRCSGRRPKTISVLRSTCWASASGTAHLEEAVKAYQNALLEWTRDRVPFQWALSEHNLASVRRLIEELRALRRAASSPQS
jgi:hypothetical protein